MPERSDAHGVRVVNEPLRRIGRDNSLGRGTWMSLVEVFDHRELLGRLVSREVRAKYKNSSLGIVWSLMRPSPSCSSTTSPSASSSAPLARSPISRSSSSPASPPGASTARSSPPARTRSSTIRAWSRRCTCLGRSSRSQPSAPRSSTSSSSSRSSSCDDRARTGPAARGPAYLPLSVLLILTFATALALVLSALNVYLRDVQHLIEILLLVLFWASPIVYSMGFRPLRDRRHGAGGDLPRQPCHPRRARHAEGDVGLGIRGSDAVLARLPLASDAHRRSSSAACCCSSLSGSSPASRATSRRNCEHRNHARAIGQDRARRQAVRPPQGQVPQGPHPVLGFAIEVPVGVPRAR